jgi:SAM-dependent methyltransferase
MVHAGEAVTPTVTWTVADATHPPNNRSYRWIFSCSLAQWLPDPAATFRAWHRIAAPGAHLVSGWFVHGTLAEFLATCPEASPFEWRDTAAWLRLLAESGWQPIRHETHSFPRRHRNAVAMLREIHNVGAVVPRRFGAGRLRRALRHHDKTHGGDQGLETSFVFLRVEALRA